MSATTSKLMTADKLLAMGDIGRCELIYGELVKLTIQVRHRGGRPVTFKLHEALVDEQVLPGFSLPLRKVFQLP